MTNLTDKETEALTYLVSVTEFDGDEVGFTDAIPKDVAKACGWDMQATGGVLSSLEKKGLIQMDGMINGIGNAMTEISVFESAEALVS